MADGTGINGLYPSLANADSIMNDIPGMVNSILNGGEVSGMSHSFLLSDQQVSDLLNYIRNSWSNEEEAVLPEEIQPALHKSEEGD
jgi:nitrite reductase (NO-forming)